MTDTFVLNPGQIYHLDKALVRHGWTPQDVHNLSGGDHLKQVLEVLQGRATITPIEHLIDCDADPYLPDGWSVEEHRKGGQWKWNPAKVKLWLTKGQQGDKLVKGDELRKELKNKLVLNANVLDYLLKNPHLIPEEWKSKFIFFWGTIYRGRSGSLCVRGLCWGGGGWGWDYHWLGRVWDADRPAALRAS